MFGWEERGESQTPSIFLPVGGCQEPAQSGFSPEVSLIPETSRCWERKIGNDSLCDVSLEAAQTVTYPK
jgi:hypothetical protein